MFNFIKRKTNNELQYEIEEKPKEKKTREVVFPANVEIFYMHKNTTALLATLTMETEEEKERGFRLIDEFKTETLPSIVTFEFDDEAMYIPKEYIYGLKLIKETTKIEEYYE